ncbi:MAG: hypothetical protein Q8R55_03980 [Candidatus Taylorbacteria bacterium]|nr:hypothetical protein [Candidatus Taylorbacteria bacterium]
MPKLVVLYGHGLKPVADTKPIVWGYRHWSLLERAMDGFGRHPAVGFVFISNMNKQKTKLSLVVLVAAFLFVSQPSSTFAVEGTCSWHGGVDCRAMADWDGSAICNDGWRDSSEKYYSTSECTKNLHYCTEAESASLNQKYNVDEKYKKAHDIYKLMMTYSVSSATDSQELRNIAIEVNKLSAQHSAALLDVQFAVNQADKECYALGDIRYERDQSEFLKQLERISEQTQNTPQYTCPANSTPNENNSCSCNGGYSNYKEQCVITNDYCKLTYGINSLSKIIDGAERCICDVGYSWDSPKTSCNKIETQSIPQSAPTPIKSPETKPTFLHSIIIPKEQSVPIIKKLGKTANIKATATPQTIKSQVQNGFPAEQPSTVWKKLISPFKKLWRKMFK